MSGTANVQSVIALQKCAGDSAVTALVQLQKGAPSQIHVGHSDGAFERNADAKATMLPELSWANRSVIATWPSTGQ